MKQVLRYLKPYTKECIMAPLFKMLEASFELFIPYVVAAVIDVGIPGGSSSYILKMCGILIGLGIVGLICAISAQYYAAKAATGFAASIRHEAFLKINELPYEQLDTIGTPTLITRMTSDVNQLQQGVNMVLRLFLRSPFIVIGAAVMAFTVDAGEAVTFVVTIPALSIVVFGIMVLSLPMFSKVQNALDKVLNATREGLSGARVIRAFNRQSATIADFNSDNDKLTALQLKAQRLSALMNPITYVIVNVALIILLSTGANKVNLGNLSQGKLVALVNYMSQILVELVKLANLIILIIKSVASGRRIGELLATSTDQPVVKDTSDANDSAVCFRNVSFTYKGAAAPSLINASFSVGKGQTVGIIGGTGSGKSTLINLIPRFYDPQHGQILINGKDITSYDIAALREKIGIVPQRAILFAGSIRDNLRFGNESASDEQIYAALERAQALEFVESKGEGLDFQLEQGGKNLSGGQKQRLTIARALVREPEILILDDSSSALDYATDRKLRSAITAMKGITTFVVSQRTSSVQHADQIFVMDDCSIIAQGSHKELLSSCQLYREIHDTQFGSDGKEVSAT